MYEANASIWNGGFCSPGRLCDLHKVTREPELQSNHLCTLGAPFTKDPLKGHYEMLFLLYNVGQEISHCRKRLFNIDENKKDEFSGKLSSP